jgi:hypothetical protein
LCIKLVIETSLHLEGLWRSASYELHPFFTSAIGAATWSTSHPGRFTPIKYPPVPVGTWVDPHRQFGHTGEKRSRLTLTGIDGNAVCLCPASNLVTLRTTLTQLVGFVCVLIGMSENVWESNCYVTCLKARRLLTDFLKHLACDCSPYFSVPRFCSKVSDVSVDRVCIVAR